MFKQTHIGFIQEDSKKIQNIASTWKWWSIFFIFDSKKIQMVILQKGKTKT